MAASCPPPAPWAVVCGASSAVVCRVDDQVDVVQEVAEDVVRDVLVEGERVGVEPVECLGRQPWRK